MAVLTVDEISSFSNAYNSRALLTLDMNKKKLEFWLKSFNIPSISRPFTEVAYNPYSIKLEGNNISYGELSVTVYLDEDFQVYSDLYDWIVLGVSDLGDPENDDRPIINSNVLVFDNTMQRVLANFKFYDVMLTGIPDIPYNTFGSDPIELSLTLPFTKMIPDFT